jgi:hypothetical protein
LLLLFKLRRIQRQPSQLLRYLEFSIEKWWQPFENSL